VAGFFGARLSARLGIGRLLVLTGAATTIGFLMVAHLPATGSYSPVLAAVTLIGFGTAGTSFGATVTASAGMADEDQGLVGGVINTARQVGAAFGAALLLAIAEGAGGEGGVANVVGDRHAMLAGAGAGAVATLVAWRGARSAEESERDLTFTRNTGRTHATSNARP
jgi:MFS family permease